VARSTTGVYGGVSAAARQQSRRDRLVAAGLDLLGTEGWRATTVRGACARAKLTPRYFYESFADLDALVLAVFDEIGAELAQAVLEAVTPPPGDARATARAAIGAAVDVITGDPRKGRVLFAEGMGSEALTRRRVTTLRGFASMVAAQGRAFYGVGEPDDPLVETTALMLVGGIAETFMAWLDGSLHTTRERLIEDCAGLFVATGEAAVRMSREQH
jgi:AcrR family transcriptional regulator